MIEPLIVLFGFMMFLLGTWLEFKFGFLRKRVKVR